MENLSLVAAIGKNNELGLDNHLIWKIKEDLSFYRRITLHQNIIMGRKTFESMPLSALEKREIFVLSRKPLDMYYNVHSYSNIEQLLNYISLTENENFIVVGGAQIYEAFLPHVDTMYLTQIEDYASADTYFPDIDINDWKIEVDYHHEGSEYVNSSDISYTRNKYMRRRIK